MLQVTSGRAARGIGTLVATIAVGALIGCTPLPPIPPPDPEPPDARPGDVLTIEDSRFSADPLFGSPVPFTEAWRVLYRSEDVHGNAVDVSGTVISPTTPWLGAGDRPLVTYAPGTRGIGDDCAPSSTLNNGSDYESLLIAPLLARGWAVAVTDYEGLGTPGRHTYMVGESQGKAVLNMARAAQTVAGTEVTAASKVGIMGYSQGGGGAAWAAELTPDYAPELDVVGAAAGGVPADLGATGEFLDGSLFVAFAFMAALGNDAAYPELDLESYLDPAGLVLYDSAQDVCLVSFDGFGVLVGTAFQSIDDFTHTNPLEDPLWQERLGRSTLGATPPEIPMHLYHAWFDEIVPFGPAKELRDTYCAAGVDVAWVEYPIAEHLTGALEGAPGATSWLAARFAGLPAPDNC